jgi:hypothetical protein
MLKLARVEMIGFAITAVLVAAGIGLLAVLGAPSRFLILNAAGLVCGLVLLAVLPVLLRRLPAELVAGAVVVLLFGVALAGFALEDVRRWVRLGPFTVHAGFVLIPILLGASSRLGVWLPAVVLLAGGAIWLQPDAGIAAGFAAAVAGLAIARPGVATLASAGLAVALAVATWLQPDPLAPAAFVEHVVEQAWLWSPVHGVAASVLLVLVCAPFLVLGWLRLEMRAGLWALGGFWAGVSVASLLGHFPTPLIGAGVGPIVGYAVSWAACAASSGLGREAAAD